jgi:hypothetical protein
MRTVAFVAWGGGVAENFGTADEGRAAIEARYPGAKPGNPHGCVDSHARGTDFLVDGRPVACLVESVA